MRKALLITPVLLSLSSFSQNILITNVGNQMMPQQQQQSIQVFASNMMVNDNNTNKPARANANPQVYVQRASNASGNQRQQVRRRVTNVSNISNPVQTNIINIPDNNISDDIQIQLQGNFNDVNDNNIGNAFGNENLIEQIASVNIPAIQVGTGSLNLNLDLPSIKVPSVKFVSRKSVSSSKHKTHTMKKKLAKLNRKMTGKLSIGKKIKIKVDNCFKW
jgi:hypothetical protein